MPRVTIDSSGRYQPKFWCGICLTSVPQQCWHLPADAAKVKPEPERDPEPINDGGSAFPRFGRDVWGGTSTLGTGMSLRDWFAGQALAGMTLDDLDVDNAAFYAYMIADAMIRARSEQ